MADPTKTPIPAPPLNERARNLQAVSRQLADMIDLLKADRDRREARIHAVEEAPAPGGDDAATRAEIASLREEEGRLRQRLDEIEALRRSASDELVGLQEQIAHAVGLHVAMRRLHEAGDRAAVVEAIQDVVVNIVGSEQMAILATGRGGALELAASMGEESRAADLDPRTLAAALDDGEIRAGPGAPAPGGALACVPLRARGKGAGLLLLFGLLPQKPALGPQDLEVLELLQVHGAIALLATAPQGHLDAVG